MQEQGLNQNKQPLVPSLLKAGLVGAAVLFLGKKLYNQLLFTRYPWAPEDTQEYAHEQLHQILDAIQAEKAHWAKRIAEIFTSGGRTSQSEQNKIDETESTEAWTKKQIKIDHKRGL